MGTPAALVLRPREQNDMPHRAVKRFSRCSENKNLTDDFEQQGLEPHWVLECLWEQASTK
jgi:hypothetical protein